MGKPMIKTFTLHRQHDGSAFYRSSDRELEDPVFCADGLARVKSARTNPDKLPETLRLVFTTRKPRNNKARRWASITEVLAGFNQWKIRGETTQMIQHQVRLLHKFIPLSKTGDPRIAWLKLEKA